MTPSVALTGLVLLLAAATIGGMLLQRRRGRVRHIAEGQRLTLADLDAGSFGERGTVVQFSTEYCARCPGVRRQLTELTRSEHSIDFVHIDVTQRPELVKQFNLLQTPTILLLDDAGRLRTRLSGPVDRQTLAHSISQLSEGSS